MKTIGFFNNKGGVGKTSLVYHLAWMFAETGHITVAADLDPQANLSAMFMNDDELQEMWKKGETVYSALRPIIVGTGDIAPQKARPCGDNIFLISGDMRLSGYEDKLSENWPKCLGGWPQAESAFRVETAFFRITQNAARQCGAEYVLADVGPNLGAINRAAILACDYIVTPLSPDLFSWQGLRNMKVLSEWRSDWRQRTDHWEKGKAEVSEPSMSLPTGDMNLLGYVPMRFTILSSKPVKSYQKWMDLMPGAFAKLQNADTPSDMENDPNFLGMLKDYHSLMPMAQEKKKPMFHLTAADGAFGAHATSVQKCREDFQLLAKKIIGKIN